MAEGRDVHERHVLLIGSENVRRILDLEAGEGPSTQPDRVFVPRVEPPSESQMPAGMSTTPKKHRGVLRGIRHRMEGMRPRHIEEYMHDLDREETERVIEYQGWSSEEDITRGRQWG